MRSLPRLLTVAALGLAACTAPSGEDAAAGETTSAAATKGESSEPAELRYTPQFVLEKVLERKRLPFDANKPFPEIRFGSQTPLTEFQDAIEPQWGMRPAKITNAYAVARNVVYLMDDAAYYAQHGRCIDDSLAHELTHYVQVVYQGWVLDGMDDSIEWNAIDVQTWFREQFCRP